MFPKRLQPAGRPRSYFTALRSDSGLGLRTSSIEHGVLKLCRSHLVQSHKAAAWELVHSNTPTTMTFRKDGQIFDFHEHFVERAWALSAVDRPVYTQTKSLCVDCILSAKNTCGFHAARTHFEPHCILCNTRPASTASESACACPLLSSVAIATPCLLLNAHCALPVSREMVNQCKQRSTLATPRMRPASMCIVLTKRWDAVPGPANHRGKKGILQRDRSHPASFIKLDRS